MLLLHKALMTKLKNIYDSIMSLNENDLLHVIMYGGKNFDNSMNKSTLTATIKFIKDSERFDQILFSIIIKSILIFSFIPFLNLLLKISFELKLRFFPWYLTYF